MMSRTIILLLSLFLLSCTKTEPSYKELSKQAVILAFGDSLTYGTGASAGQSYPAILSKLTGRAVINAGIPGELSAQGLRRLPSLLDQHQPEMLILIHGANDILRKLPLEKTRSNLEAMIALAQQRNIQVLLLGVPSFNVLFLNSAPFYKKVAETYNIPIDLETLSTIIAERSLKSDQIHPNNAGYAMMAENIYQLLLKEGAL